MDEKIRVNLGNDQWWDIMPVQTQAMRKQIKKSAQREATEQMRTESRPMARNTEVAEADQEVRAKGSYRADAHRVTTDGKEHGSP